MIFPICLSVKKYIGILGKSVCGGVKLILHNELINYIGYISIIPRYKRIAYTCTSYFNPISGTCVMNPVFKRQLLHVQGIYMFLTGFIKIEWDTLNVSTL